VEEIVRYPIPTVELSRLTAALSRSDSNSISDIDMSSSMATLGIRSKAKTKPIAIIFGHGLWSNLELEKSLNWFDTVLKSVTTTLGDNSWSGLFITPSAAGKEKPDEWLILQGNKALCLFEEAMALEVKKRDRMIFSGNDRGVLEHLGTWNMSIQARKYDGVHLDMKGNLVKAMMALNWLAML
jgi:hypothetical protein